MSALLEHLLLKDVNTLRASEVSQCLFYLDRLSVHPAEFEESILAFREKLNGRLSELREAKKEAGEDSRK